MNVGFKTIINNIEKLTAGITLIDLNTDYNDVQLM